MKKKLPVMLAALMGACMLTSANAEVLGTYPCPTLSSWIPTDYAGCQAGVGSCITPWKDAGLQPWPGVPGYFRGCPVVDPLKPRPQFHMPDVEMSTSPPAVSGTVVVPLETDGMSRPVVVMATASTPDQAIGGTIVDGDIFEKIPSGEDRHYYRYTHTPLVMGHRFVGLGRWNFYATARDRQGMQTIKQGINVITRCPDGYYADAKPQCPAKDPTAAGAACVQNDRSSFFCVPPFKYATDATHVSENSPK